MSELIKPDTIEDHFQVLFHGAARGYSGFHVFQRLLISEPPTTHKISICEYRYSRDIDEYELPFGWVHYLFDTTTAVYSNHFRTSTRLLWIGTTPKPVKDFLKPKTFCFLPLPNLWDNGKPCYREPESEITKVMPSLLHSALDMHSSWWDSEFLPEELRYWRLTRFIKRLKRKDKHDDPFGAWEKLNPKRLEKAKMFNWLVKAPLGPDGLYGDGYQQLPTRHALAGLSPQELQEAMQDLPYLL